jgi:hypothetical protein
MDVGGRGKESGGNGEKGLGNYIKTYNQKENFSTPIKGIVSRKSWKKRVWGVSLGPK